MRRREWADTGTLTLDLSKGSVSEIALEPIVADFHWETHSVDAIVVLMDGWRLVLILRHLVLVSIIRIYLRFDALF